MAGTPSSQGPPMVPAESGPKNLKLKSSWPRRRRSKILTVSLKHWKGRGGGGLPPLLLRCTAVLIHPCPSPWAPAGLQNSPRRRGIPRRRRSAARRLPRPRPPKREVDAPRHVMPRGPPARRGISGAAGAGPARSGPCVPPTRIGRSGSGLRGAPSAGRWCSGFPRPGPVQRPKALRWGRHAGPERVEGQIGGS